MESTCSDLTYSSTTTTLLLSVISKKIHSSFQIHFFPLELNGRTKTLYLYLGSDKNMGTLWDQ